MAKIQPLPALKAGTFYYVSFVTNDGTMATLYVQTGLNETFLPRAAGRSIAAILDVSVVHVLTWQQVSAEQVTADGVLAKDIVNVPGMAAVPSARPVGRGKDDEE